jgi:hypothetical protein
LIERGDWNVVTLPQHLGVYGSPVDELLSPDRAAFRSERRSTTFADPSAQAMWACLHDYRHSPSYRHPRKGAINPRIRDSCPVRPDFSRLIDSRELPAHVCRQAAAPLTASVSRSPIHDILTVPDTIPRLSDSAGMRTGACDLIIPLSHKFITVT